MQAITAPHSASHSVSIERSGQLSLDVRTREGDEVTVRVDVAGSAADTRAERLGSTAGISTASLEASSYELVRGDLSGAERESLEAFLTDVENSVARVVDGFFSDSVSGGAVAAASAFAALDFDATQLAAFSLNLELTEARSERVVYAPPRSERVQLARTHPVFRELIEALAAHQRDVAERAEAQPDAQIARAQARALTPAAFVAAVSEAFGRI